MRYIDLSIIDEHDPEVERWMREASLKKARLSSLITHNERQKYLERNDTWNAFKLILIKYFGMKCWYSECDLTGSFGDVDHFRPKNRSTDENDNVVLGDGYWWLAYDYMNYRLSCEKCNRPFGKGGKRDRFPLKSGTLPAIAPLQNDIPFLLDPCVSQDTQLIDCDETGEIISLSGDDYEKKRVLVSRTVYNWNCFNTARRDVRNRCKTALELFELIYERMPDKLETSLAQIKDLTDDKTPYSSFAKKYIKRKIEGKPFAAVLSIFL